MIGKKKVVHIFARLLGSKTEQYYKKKYKGALSGRKSYIFHLSACIAHMDA